jgi:hypothetical protein
MKRASRGFMLRAPRALRAHDARGGLTEVCARRARTLEMRGTRVATSNGVGMHSLLPGPSHPLHGLASLLLPLLYGYAAVLLLGAGRWPAARRRERQP